MHRRCISSRSDDACVGVGFGPRLWFAHRNCVRRLALASVRGQRGDCQLNAFRNGAVCRQAQIFTIFRARHGLLNIKHRRLRPIVAPGIINIGGCLGRGGGLTRQRSAEEGSTIPYASVARLSLPSVVSAERLPTSCPVQDDSRVPIWSACSNAMSVVRRTRHNTCIIGNRVPARGHRWIATLRRGSFLLSLARLPLGCSRAYAVSERHRLLAREAELGAVPPHPVKYHADAPGQGNSRALLAAQLRQT